MTIFALFVIEFGTYYTYIPVFAGTSLHASGAQIGIILSCESVAFSLVASQIGLLARHFSEKRLVTLAFILCALSLAVIPAIRSPWLLILPIIVFGASQGLAFPPLQSMLAQSAPEGYRAGFMSLNVTVQSLGRALGGLFAGIIFSVLGMQGVFYITATLALITIVVFNSLVSFKQVKIFKQLRSSN